jgi:hypothetical protein
MEGVRGDASETEGRLVVPGENEHPVNYSTAMYQPIYILSFCGPEVDVKAMACRFGTFLVRLTNADDLALSLYQRLADHPAAGRRLHFGDRGAVDYSKGQTVQSTPPRADRLRLNWIQKPPSYSTEQEYRIAFICEGLRSDAPKHICAPLPAQVAGTLEEVSRRGA